MSDLLRVDTDGLNDQRKLLEEASRLLGEIRTEFEGIAADARVVLLDGDGDLSESDYQIEAAFDKTRTLTEEVIDALTGVASGHPDALANAQRLFEQLEELNTTTAGSPTTGRRG